MKSVLFNSAGGGGSKSETRKTRIVEKNKKLTEERARAAKESAKRKRIEGSKNTDNANAAAPTGDGEPEADAFAGIHPSRRSRVPV